MNSNVKKEEKCLKVGVLGCGIINQAAHLIGCSKARNIHLQAICDVAEDLLRKMAAIYEPDSIYTDYADMLADPQVEAVIIGVGDQFHVPLAKMAVEAGKHVFLEKPMGVSIEECEELKAAAEAKSLVLQIGHMKRFDEGLQFAKQFKEEKMGEITTYKGWYCDSVGRYTLTDNVMPILYSSGSMRKPSGNPKAVLDHYYILGHGSHLLDTALYFMGPIDRISARYVHKGSMHSWLIDCDFACGAIGTLDLTDEASCKAFSEKLVHNSARLQRELLRKAAGLLKAGGTLLYSTCSLLPEENAQSAREMEKLGLIPDPITPDGVANLRLLDGGLPGSVTVCPNEWFEGFFMARYRKKK